VTQDEYLVERWSRPIRIFAVTEDADSFVRFGEGEGWRRGTKWVTDKEGFQRMWDGQVCFFCTEPQPPPAPDPVPEKCSLCGYAMREHQRRDLEREFYGEEHVGGSTSISEELDRLDDTAERWRHKRVGSASILVPRGVK
jgi:hypothetical protein